jgi:hypothetical protein
MVPIDRKRVRELAGRPAEPADRPPPRLHGHSPVIELGRAYERVGAAAHAIEASGFASAPAGAIAAFEEAARKFDHAASRFAKVVRNMRHRKRQSEAKRARWAKVAGDVAAFRETVDGLVEALRRRRGGPG